MACGRVAPVHAVLAMSGLLALIAAVPAMAQTLPAPLQPPAATAPSKPCQLHVWPAVDAHTTFQGWVRAGAVDGARRGIKGYPDLHAGTLDTAQQARLLAATDWRSAFGDPTLDVVVHSAPTGADDDRTRVGRLVAEGPSSCYRELIISSVIVESGVFSTQSVRVLALRKRFDGVDAAPVNFSSMSQAVISLTDADKAAPDAPARMDAAVQAAFAAAVGKFAVMQSFH